MSSDKIITTKVGIPVIVVQSLSWVVLGLLLFFDKGLGVMVNPPSNHFYAVAAIVAVFGNAGIKLLEDFLRKKL